eukprot:226229-Chlamydomonas_euryale.AAC.1
MQERGWRQLSAAQQLSALYLFFHAHPRILITNISKACVRERRGDRGGGSRAKGRRLCFDGVNRGGEAPGLRGGGLRRGSWRGGSRLRVRGSGRGGARSGGLRMVCNGALDGLGACFEAQDEGSSFTSPPPPALRTGGKEDLPYLLRHLCTELRVSGLGFRV